MDHLQKFNSEFRTNAFVFMLGNGILTIGGTIAACILFDIRSVSDNVPLVVSIAGIAVICSSALTAWLASGRLLSPIRFLWEAVLHVSPDTAVAAAPDAKQVRLGREFVTVLAAHVYQLATVVDTVESTASKPHTNLKTDFVANSLPLPLVILNGDSTVLFANETLCTYIGTSQGDITGQNVYTVLDFLFDNENTLDTWLQAAKTNKVTDTASWERVRLDLGDDKGSRYFDLVAYYNKNNPEGFEVMLVFFDRTKQYARDVDAMNFVALAAHELRTPITLLRGYIDAFEEELDGKLDPELADFMRKMQAAGQQLAAFTSTILNVSRFENNQLLLKLREEQLGPILKMATDNLQLRAQVRGVKLTLKIDDNLPAVAADAVSIGEVINNLVDNAIKYSGQGKEIAIHAYLTNGGVVETTVQDSGVGIPQAALGNLFTKFYRDYHNRNHVTGTGMGLYLSKAIIDAHGGNIWVKSHEGQGSTFGFTLIPYSQLADEAKNSDSHADVTRTAHGWIKNHSLYRR